MTIAARPGLAASDVQPARSNKLLFVLPFIALIAAFFLFVYQKSEKLSSYHDHENFRILSQVAGGINEQLNSLAQMRNAGQSESVIRNRFPSYQKGMLNEDEGNTQSREQKITFEKNKVSFSPEPNSDNKKTVEADTVAVSDIIRQAPLQFSKIFISDKSGSTQASVGADARLSAFNFSWLLNEKLCEGQTASLLVSTDKKCDKKYEISRNDVMDISLAGENYRLYIYPFIVQVELNGYNNTEPLYIIALIRNIDNNYLKFIKSPVVALLLFIGMLLIWCVFKIELQSIHHPIGIFFSKVTVLLFFITLALIYSFIMSQYYAIDMNERRTEHAKKYLTTGRNSIDTSIEFALNNTYSNADVFRELSKNKDQNTLNKTIRDNLEKNKNSLISKIYKKEENNSKCKDKKCKLSYVQCKPAGNNYCFTSNASVNTTENKLKGINNSAFAYFISKKEFSVEFSAPKSNINNLPEEDQNLINQPYEYLTSCRSAFIKIIELPVCHYNFNSINKFGISNGVNFLFREIYSKPVIYDLNHRSYFTDLMRAEQKYSYRLNYPNSVQRLKNIGDGTKGTTVSVLVSVEDARPGIVLNSDITASALDYFDPALFDMSAFVINKHTGIVQFHNDSSLELNENIYAQNSDNTNLETYIKHEPLSFDDPPIIHGSYHGQTGFYLVSKMENSDWAFIVFVPDLPVDVYEKSIFISFFAIIVVFIIFYAIISFIRNRYFDQNRIKEVLLFPKKSNTKKLMLYSFGIYLTFMLLACLALKNKYDMFSGFILTLVLFITLNFILNRITSNITRQDKDSTSSRIPLFTFNKGVAVTSLLMSALFTISLHMHKNAEHHIEHYISDGLMNYYCIRNTDNKDTLQNNALANFKNRINAGDVSVADLYDRAGNDANVSLTKFAPPQTSLGLVPDLREACPKDNTTRTPNPVASVIFDETKVFGYISPLLSLGLGGGDYTPLLGNTNATNNTESSAMSEEDIETPQQAIAVISSVFFVNQFDHWSILIFLLSAIVFLYFCRIYDNYLSWVIFGRTGFKRDIAVLFKHWIQIQSDVRPANLLLSNSPAQSPDLPVVSYRDLYAPSQLQRYKRDPFELLVKQLAILRSSASWASYDPVLDMMRWQIHTVADDIVLICSGVESLYIQNESEKHLYDFVADMAAAVKAGLLQGFVLCMDELVLQQRLSSVSGKSDTADANYRWLLLLRQFMSSECSPVNATSLRTSTVEEYVHSLIAPHPARSFTPRDKELLHEEIRRIPALCYLDPLPSDTKSGDDYSQDKSHSLWRHESSIYGRNRLAVSWLTARAQYLYRYFWCHCTDQEKICLYFLASKGTFNPKNQATLEALAARGLVRMARGRVAVVNQSFAHFVRHAESEPAMAALIKATEHGSWHLYKYPLTVLVGLVIIAVCIVGAQSLSYAISSIVAVVAMVAGVANNFSLIRNVVRAS